MLKKKYYTGLQIHEAIDGVVGDYKKAIEIYRRLAKMETDDVQPVKHGKWINDKGLYKCTACNNVLTVAGWDIPEEQIYKSFKFCPNCGAKMERSEE